MLANVCRLEQANMQPVRIDCQMPSDGGSHWRIQLLRFLYCFFFGNTTAGAGFVD